MYNTLIPHPISLPSLTILMYLGIVMNIATDLQPTYEPLLLNLANQ